MRRVALHLGELTVVMLAFALVAATGPAGDGTAPLPPEGWSVTLSEDYEPADFVIALREGGNNRIELLHPWTGAWMATIRTSSGPMIVRRPSAGQIIVSDLLRKIQMAVDHRLGRRRRLDRSPARRAPTQ